jgi:hypothetical protein
VRQTEPCEAEPSEVVLERMLGPWLGKRPDPRQKQPARSRIDSRPWVQVATPESRALEERAKILDSFEASRVNRATQVQTIAGDMPGSTLVTSLQGSSTPNPRARGSSAPRARWSSRS